MQQSHVIIILSYPDQEADEETKNQKADEETIEKADQEAIEKADEEADSWSVRISVIRVWFMFLNSVDV